MKKLIILISIFVILVVAGTVLAYFLSARNVVTSAQAKTITENFINNNLLPAEMKATIKSAVLANDVYDITLEVSGKEYHSFLSKDGKKFFQTGVDIAEIEKQTQASQTDQTSQNATPATTVSTKTDKPEVELFVMSYCPYGTQIEKGILPVLQALGNKINFALKFCSYAMHGIKEVDENLTQYCIEKEQSAKLTDYLTCFLKAGDSAGCLKQVKVDETKLKACVSATDKQYKITEQFNDKSTWSNPNYPPFDIYKADNLKYAVSGSPTLVINQTKISANRDAASLLAVICSAFNTRPAECDKVLSGVSPSAGFGEGTAAASSAADCATQ